MDIPAHLADQHFSRNRSDDAFIHAALTANAPRLIRGDNDLLSTNPPASLNILTPRAAWEKILAPAA